MHPSAAGARADIDIEGMEARGGFSKGLWTGTTGLGALFRSTGEILKSKLES